MPRWHASWPAGWSRWPARARSERSRSGGCWQRWTEPCWTCPPPWRTWPRSAPRPPAAVAAGGFPQVRLVTLTACGTRGILDAAFRGRRAPRSSEQDLARKIAARGRCGPGMLVTADRNFGGYPVAAVLATASADLLIRVKSSQWLPVLQARKGSPSSVRRIDCRLVSPALPDRTHMHRLLGQCQLAGPVGWRASAHIQ